ncbi:MAG: hypothetical protein WDZ56_00680 [Candidatus Paceibacterota bacterium]
MSSLRFTKPIRLEGLPPEVAEEWVGLEVGLASAAPAIFGYLGPAPARIWDEESESWGDDTFCDMEEISNKLYDAGLCISIGKLIECCKYSDPPRPHLLAWLLKEGTIQYFIVNKEAAEYLP